MTAALTPALLRAEARRSPLRRLVRDRAALVGLGIVGVFALAAVFGPSLAPHDPLEVTVDRLQGPGARHLLGTDGLGRDLLSRVLTGARLSMGSALAASAAVTVIGVAVGVVAGYWGGLLDKALMRVVDVVLALPALVLALAVAGLFDPGLGAVLFALVSIWWAGYARIVRGIVVSLREREYVEAARASGSGRGRVLLRHVLPNVLPSVAVLGTLEIGQVLLAVSGLSFLGLGAQPPEPEWGSMLNDGRLYFLSHPHVVLVPGVAIALAVLGFNLLGDGLRDASDPRSG